MFLKSLEIQGFKSFPDKTVLNFEKGITAVVGPNGSGKSNISDAIRWVLGEVSSKALRGSKMEDVIFGGAVSRRPLGYAEVSLSLDNAGRELQYDGDEVKITRRYYRSGESDYELCGKAVRLKDIHELLMDTGLGRDGYSIIGQGKIEEIVAAKSEDRREIFEEAAGISKYRYRKEDSQRRLADTEENLVRLRDIISELDSRVGPLREQAKKAKKYIELAGEKKKLEVGLWLNTLDKQRETLREHENRIGYARAQYDTICENLDGIQKEIERAYLDSQKKAAIIEQCRVKSRELYDEAVKKHAEIDILKNDMARNNEEMERLDAEIKEAEGSGGKNEDEISRLRGEIDKKNSEAGEIANRLSEFESGISDILKQSEGLSGELEKAGAELSALTMRQSDARIEKNGAVSSIAHLKERAGTVDGEIELRRRRAEEIKRGLEQCAAKGEKRGEDAQSLENEKRGYELKLKSKKERLARLDETIRSFSLGRDGKLQRASMLEDLERSMEGFSQSVKAVMREKARGRLAGIHAPVSKIIQVRPDCTVAVETALGFSAQHIVVDNEESAKAAIGMLKRANAGRATFLPVTSVHGTVISYNGLSQENGFVGIASELVSYDAAYTGIVRSLLGRTAVAQDLDCAVRIAKKYGYRFRIVTLDGQLVNAGGSMTGGSIKHGAGLLSRAADIKKLREEAAEINKRIDAASGERSAAAREVSAIEASVSGINGELTCAQEDIIRLSAEKRGLEQQSIQADREIESLLKEKSESNLRINTYEYTVTQKDDEIKNLNEKIEEIQRRAETLGGNRNRLMKMREERAEKIAELRLKKVSCEKDAEVLKQNMQSIMRESTNVMQRVRELRIRKQKLDENNLTASENIKTLGKEEETLRRESDEKTAESGKIAGQREQAEQESAKLRDRERAATGEREKLSGELARLEERRSSVRADYDSIIARLLDEYELTRSEAEKEVPKIEDVPAAKKRLYELKGNIKSLGQVNVGAIDEYAEVSKRYEFMKEQTDDVEKSKRELEALIETLTGKMREIFKEQFEVINRNFSETFVELFGGGSARLELTQPDDILSSGIEIIVQPPGKIIKNLSMLSGGERAFVAIALYFAILKVRPSPFCVLDEIEAALDDANVARFAAYLRRMCGSTQFIVITHRRGTMDGADVLYGVTMQDEGVSKLLTLDVDALVEKLGLRN